MSAPWRAITTGIWRNPWFRGLAQDAQFAWLFLLTNPATVPSGLYWLDVDAMGGILRGDRSVTEGFLKAFAEAGRLVHAEGDWILLPTYMAHQPGVNTNIWRSILAQLAECPKDLVAQWFTHNTERIPDAMRKPFQSLSEGLPQALGGRRRDVETYGSSGLTSSVPLGDVRAGLARKRVREGRQRQEAAPAELDGHPNVRAAWARAGDSEADEFLRVLRHRLSSDVPHAAVALTGMDKTLGNGNPVKKNLCALYVAVLDAVLAQARARREVPA